MGIIELDSDDVKRKYRNFKKFEIVEDYSDHHFLKSKSSQWQASVPPRDWAKKIQQEWRILERHLPDMIFVRVYEGRMDLLRAVIIGVEETPYYNGLFFFDVCIPKNYPNDPPHFEDLVIGHFHDRASGILTTCKAYHTEGAGVKYGVDVRYKPDGLLKLRKDVEGYMKTLVGAFKQIGVVEDLEDFVPPTENITELQKKKNLTHKILACFGI
ncbi:hypothetical protein L1987_74066 [Smallanthus sonchifolius]|uniref:Uncharacterized protein n=1 Tax=Smallanthus sonchifolius TaxID=185202 RepID=A0ACB9A648_9ASTR|nr:hypothetical protein L1987_74066 [Smallanthus sonchifolius]